MSENEGRKYHVGHGWQDNVNSVIDGIWHVTSFLPTAASETNVLDGTEILQGTHCKDHKKNLTVVLLSVTGGIETSSLKSGRFDVIVPLVFSAKNITAPVEH